MFDYLDGKGTLGDGNDHCSSNIRQPPYSEGRLTWHIPNYYKVDEGGNGIVFVYVDQIFTIDENGNMTLTKGEVRKPAARTAPGSGY
jgi:hypothetical protein